MMRPPALILGGLALGLLAGCAYYNGLYNANRLVKAAEKAEREGRVGEARSFWAQAAVKAESVVARYPESKYRDDALLLRGRATVACCGQLELGYLDSLGLLSFWPSFRPAPGCAPPLGIVRSLSKLT